MKFKYENGVDVWMLHPDIESKITGSINPLLFKYLDKSFDITLSSKKL